MNMKARVFGNNRQPSPCENTAKTSGDETIVKNSTIVNGKQSGISKIPIEALSREDLLRSKLVFDKIMASQHLKDYSSGKITRRAFNQFYLEVLQELDTSRYQTIISTPSLLNRIL